MPSDLRPDAERPQVVPEVTLRTYALGAVAAQLPPPDQTSGPEIQFLFRQFQTVTAGQERWLQSLSHYLQQPAAEDRFLLQAARQFQLTALEVLTIALAVAVEEEVMVGRALAAIQTPLGGSRPMLSLAAAAFGEATNRKVHPVHHLVRGPAMQSGLLQRLHPDLPLPEQTVQVPLHLVFALGGRDSAVAGMTLGLAPTSTIPLAASTLAQAQHYAELLKPSARPVLALRTGSVAEGKTVAQAVAQALDLRPLFIETAAVDGVAPWLYLRGLLPVFCLELAPGEQQQLPVITAYDGPCLALCGSDGTLAVPSGEVLNWSLPVPPRAERQQLWQQAMGDAALAADLARFHRHSSGRIAQLGQLARYYSRLEQRSLPTLTDITQAAWSGQGVGLDALAQCLTDVVTDEALVLEPHLQDNLNALLLRCRSRDGLVDPLGVAAVTRYHPGVRALFVGPSGTGKTLAASWLATQLAMPLYRVDLASVTSKYIGETEKNLAQLLGRAEQAEVILLFDEADSLFGKRTEVKDATDRFANTQTNYLLQRIETYDGIVLLTSNSRNRLDPAFSRRLDSVVEFTVPQPKERLLLWQTHLGKGHTLSLKDLNQLAATTDLCGGHIRNVVLAAAVVAFDQQRPIAFADVLRGLDLEYQKLGRSLPAALKCDRTPT